jgi:glycosyltransferase involved in cell wall biosynthesis
MRVLWIINEICPVIRREMGLPDSAGGGWVFSLANQISLYKEIKLCIAAVYDCKEIKFYDIEGIKYYLLPSKSQTTYQRKLEIYWQKVYEDFKPDVVHIHGTEYVHGLAFMRTFPKLNYVFSVQGIIGIISRYYLSGIDPREIFRHITLRDIMRGDSIFQAKKKFEKRGILEKEYFMRSNHVIGRTGWDFIHSKMSNPDISYHFCNECLRNIFYDSSKWDLNNITPFTIFLSQSFYPIKGLHQVLKAIALLKTDFPELRLRISGPKILRNNNLSDMIRISGYGKYIGSLIKKYKLNKNVIFTGVLNEEQMVSEYKNAHLFICPSSIENSPNSLGEAQILGVPSIATNTGGIPDMVIHEESGLLYNFEEFEILAYNIKRIFEDNNLASKLSDKGREAALKRHDRRTNTSKMIEIYEQIIDRK